MHAARTVPLKLEGLVLRCEAGDDQEHAPGPATAAGALRPARDLPVVLPQAASGVYGEANVRRAPLPGTGAQQVAEAGGHARKKATSKFGANFAPAAKFDPSRPRHGSPAAMRFARGLGRAISSGPAVAGEVGGRRAAAWGAGPAALHHVPRLVRGRAPWAAPRATDARSRSKKPMTEPAALRTCWHTFCRCVAARHAAPRGVTAALRPRGSDCIWRVACFRDDNLCPVCFIPSRPCELIRPVQLVRRAARPGPARHCSRPPRPHRRVWSSTCTSWRPSCRRRGRDPRRLQMLPPTPPKAPRPGTAPWP